MPGVAALLDSRAALGNLRRGLGAGGPPVVACRSAKGLDRAYGERVLDAVVLGPRALRGVEPDRLRAAYPAIPLIVYGPIRSEQAAWLAGGLAGGGGRFTAVAVEGVDDVVVGDLVRRHAVSRERERALADAPRLLHLSEPIQLDAWNLVLRSTGPAMRVSQLALELGVSREHLSRQFGAGGAPNLKRVIDLLRTVCAAQLLANPGYGPAQAARLLRFSSTSHLSATARRIAGEPPDRLAELGPRGVLARFLRGKTRSRER